MRKEADLEIHNETKIYDSIVRFCESCLDKYGDTYLGAAWTKTQKNADTRYRVMLEVIQPSVSRNIKLLDFGCGASHLYQYIIKQELNNIEYSGLDISDKFLSLSKQKFPSIIYYNMDILTNHDTLPHFDYVVMNGVFTAKCALSFTDMLQYFKKVLQIVFSKTNVGIAFNVMSKQVDWERDDLFHLPFDSLGSFVTTHLSRNFVIRHDYGLYEYTVYVYK
jgi:cyclopropane fatty-acyl-phospholipid synthase-like methyltransferase